MCLVLLARDSTPAYRLIVCANRDEFYARPAAPLHPWCEARGVLAGRDLTSGGTWMGITRSGRFAAVTNYRDPARQLPDAPSRGELPVGFLVGETDAGEYVAGLEPRRGELSNYNLLVDDGAQGAWCSNRGGEPTELGAGLFGLSNHLLDTPWPKVERAKARFEEALAGPSGDLVEALLALLADREPAPDDELPETGVGLDVERMLSPIFIVSPAYGTRCSSVLLVGHDGAVTFVEQTYHEGEKREPPRRYSFLIE